ncbi:hypothetical protein V6N13_142142 [Hibiscus sabdariffa]|uniref:Uncharacterized protein n=1 Tax=Hibiscus sabdariffa TaxID=183260 RepID=A0ABR2FDJ0_9ROSI
MKKRNTCGRSTGNFTLPVHGEPLNGNGGRPPDFVTQLLAFPVLERPASPIEDTRNPKKQCNEVLSAGVAHGGETVAMEAKIDMPEPGLGVQQQDAARLPSLLMRMWSMESCNTIAQRQMGDAAPQSNGSPKPEGPSVDQPYGLWMMVDNGRRKLRNGVRNVPTGEPEKVVQGFSHFAVLEDRNVENGLDGDVDVRPVLERPRPARPGFKRRKNPDKKKKSGVPRKDVEVVPSLEEHNPKLVVCSLDHARGNHKVVAIMESPLYGKGSYRVRISKPHVVVTRNFKENSRRGTKSSKLALQVSNELDMLERSMVEGASTSGGMASHATQTTHHPVEVSDDEDVMDESDGVVDGSEEDPKATQ